MTTNHPCPTGSEPCWPPPAGVFLRAQPPAPGLDRHLVELHAGPQVWSRAVGYRDRIEVAVSRSHEARATICGGATYEVELRWSEHLLWWRCSCPHAQVDQWLAEVV